MITIAILFYSYHTFIGFFLILHLHLSGHLTSSTYNLIVFIGWLVGLTGSGISNK